MKILKLVFLAISALLLHACSNTKPSNDEVKLYVLDCGTIIVKDISLFSPGVDKGISKKLANACYLIKHPQGNFLWETGLSDTLVNESEGIYVAEGMFHLKKKHTLRSQLANIGLTPTDIDYVALSHFHFDHTGNMNMFSKATFLVQQNELDIAYSDKARAMYFEPSSYDQIKKAQYVGLSGDYDVFKDGRLKIYFSPGHTPGHQSLLVNLRKTGPVLLSGDLYHFGKNRKHRRVPTLNFDKNSTMRSMKNIENIIEGVNGQLWIQHDFDTFSNVVLSPNYYR